MEKYRSYIFRIYPNKEQEILINKTFGCTRFIYNYFLEQRNKRYNETKEVSSAYEQIKEIRLLKEDYPWLKEVEHQALNHSVLKLDRAFINFFHHAQRHPKFKSRNSPNRYRTNCVKLDLTNRVIQLSKLGKMKIRGYNQSTELDGEIEAATIKKEAGKYYAVILTHKHQKFPKIKDSSIVGLDMGIKNVITTSDNQKFENKKFIEKYERKIKGLNRALGRAQKGSKNYQKIRLKLQETYKRLSNARKFYAHEISNKILSEYDMVAIEDLDIAKMQQNRIISKSISDVTLGLIIKYLKYKGEWNRQPVFVINRYFPSSQLCNICDYRNKELKDLNIRYWECPNCGTEHDRDVNAGMNILFEGIKMYLSHIAPYRRI